MSRFFLIFAVFGTLGLTSGENSIDLVEENELWRGSNNMTREMRDACSVLVNLCLLPTTAICVNLPVLDGLLGLGVVCGCSGGTLDANGILLPLLGGLLGTQGQTSCTAISPTTTDPNYLVCNYYCRNYCEIPYFCIPPAASKINMRPLGGLCLCACSVL